MVEVAFMVPDIDSPDTGDTLDQAQDGSIGALKRFAYSEAGDDWRRAEVGSLGSQGAAAIESPSLHRPLWEDGGFWVPGGIAAPSTPAAIGLSPGGGSDAGIRARQLSVKGGSRHLPQAAAYLED